METKEIILPDNWEVKEVQGNKIIIGEQAEKGLPDTWRKCCEVLRKGEYVNGTSEVKKVTFDNINISESDKNLLPDGLGKPMLALCQLLVCRNAWWKQLGWKPDWNHTNKHCIYIRRGDIIATGIYHEQNMILAFPNSEIRNKFLYSFRDLIDEAKELL